MPLLQDSNWKRSDTMKSIQNIPSNRSAYNVRITCQVCYGLAGFNFVDFANKLDLATRDGFTTWNREGIQTQEEKNFHICNSILDHSKIWWRWISVFIEVTFDLFPPGSRNFKRKCSQSRGILHYWKPQNSLEFRLICTRNSLQYNIGTKSKREKFRKIPS